MFLICFASISNSKMINMACDTGCEGLWLREVGEEGGKKQEKKLKIRLYKSFLNFVT